MTEPTPPFWYSEKLSFTQKAAIELAAELSKSEDLMELVFVFNLEGN